MEKSALKLTELLLNVKDALKASLQKTYWIRAEISEISTNYSGHCYLELIEKPENSDTISAKVRATIWSSVNRMLSAYFETVTGQQLEKGLKILIKASVEFSELYGLSINILDIDPTYTIGEQERARREIIKQLEEDGVMEMNSMLELPLVSQRIAVISSQSAAGYGDFIHQLSSNSEGYTFECTLFPSVMQGQKTAESIIKALEAIFEHETEFDAVIIIRGGGSKTDLSWFDNYDLAVNIAQFPLPVISGIGHERDKSIADMVAHTSLKTPTAVAEFLIEQASNFDETISALGSDFIGLVQGMLDDHTTILQNISQNIKPIVKEAVSTEKSLLSMMVEKAEMYCNERLKAEIASTKIRSLKAIHHSNFELLKLRQHVSSLATTARQMIRANFSESEKQIEYLSSKSFAYDPARILERGFTMTLDEKGNLIRSSKSIKKAQTIVTRFIDGDVKSQRI